MVRVITADGVDLGFVMTLQCDLASALTYVRAKIPHIEAVQGADGTRICVDWSNRMATRPEAFAAFGMAKPTQHLRSLVARILRVPMDTNLVHITGGGPLIVYPALQSSLPESYVVTVRLPGKVPLRLAVGSGAAVRSIVSKVRWGWNLQVVLSRDGGTLHSQTPVAALFGLQREVQLDAQECCESQPAVFEVFPNMSKMECYVEYPAVERDTSEEEDEEEEVPYDPIPRRCPFDGHPPRITAQLLPPLWWSTTGATQVWRKAEALAAVQVAAKFGVSWALPALMHHLALAPSEWLQGQPLPGRATADSDFNINTGKLEMVTCKFTPRVPLTRGAQPDAPLTVHLKRCAISQDLCFPGGGQALPRTPSQ